METALTMILAGGRGKRMGMFCQRRAKPELPFAGNTRVIDFTLSNCIRSSLNKIMVLVDYQRTSMSDYLAEWSVANILSENLYIIHPESGSYLGTADAVYQNIEFLKKDDSELVVVLAGDHVYKMDYQRMMAYHRQIGADATVAVISVPAQQASRFGIVNIDGKVRITNFVEKPSIPTSNLVSMGIYVFSKRALIEHLVEDAALPDSVHDFGHSILPVMIEKDRVAAYRFNRYWRDIGNPGAYYAANMELLSEAPRFSLNDMGPVLTAGNHSSLSPTITGHGRVTNSMVGRGCIIKGHVENSVLSPGVIVEEEAVIRNSVVMADTSIGYQSVVENCILDEEVQIGRLCHLGFGGTVAGRGRGLSMVGYKATVPPHTAIGYNCKIAPCTGPEDLLSKVVFSGSTVSPGMNRIQLKCGEEIRRHDNKSLSAP